MIPLLTFVVIRHDLNGCVSIAQVLRVTVLSNSSHEKIIAQVNQGRKFDDAKGGPSLINI